MAEDEDYGVGRIRIVLDDSEAVADAGDLGARISRALDRNTRDIGRQIRRSVQRGLNSASVSVRVVPDLRRFDAALLSGLRSTGGLNIPVAPDLTGFNERVRALLAGEEFPVRVVPDLDDFNDRIRRHNAPDVTVNVDVDSDRLTRALSGLGNVAGRVAGALGGLLRLGAVGIAASSTAIAVTDLLSALAPAAGIMAAFPAVIGVVVATNTLRLALVGVEDAFSAAAHRYGGRVPGVAGEPGSRSPHRHPRGAARLVRNP